MKVGIVFQLFPCLFVIQLSTCDFVQHISQRVVTRGGISNIMSFILFLQMHDLLISVSHSLTTDHSNHSRRAIISDFIIRIVDGTTVSGFRLAQRTGCRKGKIACLWSQEASYLLLEGNQEERLSFLIREAHIGMCGLANLRWFYSDAKPLPSIYGNRFLVGLL